MASRPAGSPRQGEVNCAGGTREPGTVNDTRTFRHQSCEVQGPKTLRGLPITRGLRNSMCTASLTSQLRA